MRASSSLHRLLVGLGVVLALLGSPAPAAAQDGDAPATTELERDADSPVGDILPRPNSGEAPDSPNDPGGWQQYLVFAFIIGGLAAIVLLVRRESRRARSSRPPG